MRSALVLGATGLVGSALLRQLYEQPEYDRVVVLVRRPTNTAHPKLQERIVDFERLDQAGDALAVDDLYCCLGTTLAQAGGQDAQWRVDHDYPLAAARLAREAGVKQYLLVSSMGADPKSTLFYSRMKGAAEEAIAGVGLPSLQIFRPSLLMGMRERVRMGEVILAAVMKVVGPLMLGPLARYRAIEGRTVAQAMIRVALGDSAGVRRYLSDEIQRIGE